MVSQESEMPFIYISILAVWLLETLVDDNFVAACPEAVSQISLGLLD